MEEERAPYLAEWMRITSRNTFFGQTTEQVMATSPEVRSKYLGTLQIVNGAIDKIWKYAAAQRVFRPGPFYPSYKRSVSCHP